MRVFWSTISWYFLSNLASTFVRYGIEHCVPALRGSTHWWRSSLAWYIRCYRKGGISCSTLVHMCSACTRSLAPRRKGIARCPWSTLCGDSSNRSARSRCTTLDQKSSTFAKCRISQVDVQFRKYYAFLDEMSDDFDLLRGTFSIFASIEFDIVLQKKLDRGRWGRKGLIFIVGLMLGTFVFMSGWLFSFGRDGG